MSAILNQDVQAAAAIDFSKLAALASANILLGSAGNVATSTAVSGAITITNAGVTSLTANIVTLAKFVRTGNAGQVLQSNGGGADATYSTPTYPSASGSAGKILISDGTNNVYSTPTYPNTSGTAGKILRSDGTNNVYTTATFPTTAGSSGNVLTSDGTNWSSSTPSPSYTGPTTYTPTITGCGTVANVAFSFWEIGNIQYVFGTFTTGTVSAALASFTLGNGRSIDATKNNYASATNAPGAARGFYKGNTGNSTGNMVTATSTSTTLMYMADSITITGALTPRNGNAILASSAGPFCVEFWFPF